jgi:hypothetical protein
VDALGRPDAGKQASATASLRNLGDIAVPDLVRAIKVQRGMPDQRVRVLGILGWDAARGSAAAKAAALEAFAWALTEPPPVGAAAADGLVAAGAEAVPLLIPKIASGSEAEKVGSIRLLARIGTPAAGASGSLVGCLKSPGDPDAVKGEALSVLEKFWASEVVVPKELCGAIPDSGPVRVRVLKFLSIRNPRECLDELGRMLPASSPDDQVLILMSLGKAGSAGVPLVMAMDRVAATTGSAEVRSEAGKTIGWVLAQAAPSDLPQIAEALAKGTPATKKQAVVAAGKLGAGSAGLVPAILGTLKSGNPELEEESLRSLEAIGTTPAVDGARVFMAARDVRKNITLLSSRDRSEMMGAVQALAQYGRAANPAIPGLEGLFAADDSAAAREDTAALYVALARTLRAIGTREALQVLGKYEKAVLFYDAEILDADKLGRLKETLLEIKRYGEGTLWAYMERHDEEYAKMDEFAKKRFRTDRGAEIAARQDEIGPRSCAFVIPVRFDDRKYNFQEKRFKLDSFEEMTWGDDTVRFDRVVQIPPIPAGESEAEELSKSGKEVTVTVVVVKPRYYSRKAGDGVLTGVFGEVVAARFDIPGRAPVLKYYGTGR